MGEGRYTRLRGRLVLSLLAGMAAALVLGLGLAWVLRGPVEALCVWGLRQFFGQTPEEAAALARTFLRGGHLLTLACVGLMLVLAFYLMARHITGWLDRIAGAVRQAAAEEGDDIRLPRAFWALEQDLNAIRTELSDRAQAAQEADQRRQDLVAFLAHDLKTPLTSVVGYLTLLRDEPGLPPDQRAKFTGIALDKALRLQELLGEFFDISRMDLDVAPGESSPVHLSMLLEQLSDEFYPLFAEQGLQCRVEIAPGLTVMGEADKLVRALDNVLRNAVSYSIPGGDVEVTARRQGRWAEIVISNEGLEIPEGELSRIFEKFYRLDSARSTRTGGAGLGLAIAKEIVERHRGTIRCECNGRHTSFLITLPLLLDGPAGCSGRTGVV